MQGCTLNTGEQQIQESQIQQPKQTQECSSEQCIRSILEKAEGTLSDLKSFKESKLESLFNEYQDEYRKYYSELKDGIPSTGITNHEYILRNCTSYVRICNLLERSAILQYHLDWLKDKISKADLKISELDQSVWKLKKKLDVIPIASPEDSKRINDVNKVIISTKAILDDKVTPPEAQDTAKIQKDIFDQILSESQRNQSKKS